MHIITCGEEESLTRPESTSNTQALTVHTICTYSVDPQTKKLIHHVAWTVVPVSDVVGERATTNERQIGI